MLSFLSEWNGNLIILFNQIYFIGLYLDLHFHYFIQSFRKFSKKMHVQRELWNYNRLVDDINRPFTSEMNCDEILPIVRNLGKDLSKNFSWSITCLKIKYKIDLTSTNFQGGSRYVEFYIRKNEQLVFCSWVRMYFKTARINWEEPYLHSSFRAKHSTFKKIILGLAQDRTGQNIKE